MKITQNAVALLDYTLTGDDGTVLDTSDGRGPLAYLHGHGNLIPGLEEELEGKGAGDEFKVHIEPEKAYGVRNEAMVQTIERGQLPPEADVKVGLQLQAQSQQGFHVVTVIKVEGDQVTLDGNHPLAGVPLNFEVKVVEVRDASAQELEQGHAQGPGAPSDPNQ